MKACPICGCWAGIKCGCPKSELEAHKQYMETARNRLWADVPGGGEMKAREFWIVNDKTNGWRVRVQKPTAESVHVIEAAPVLAELKRLGAELAQARADLEAIDRVNMGG